MKDMFYNYDHRVVLPTDPYVGTHFMQIPKNEKLESCNCTKIIKNIKGEPIGVEAKENSVFKLYFSLDTFVDSGAVYSALSEASFDFHVYNRQHTVILHIFKGGLYVEEDDTDILPYDPETDPLTSDFGKIDILYDDDCICVELVSDKAGPLNYGLFTMQLDFYIPNIEKRGYTRYTLFSERDGKLSIR